MRVNLVRQGVRHNAVVLGRPGKKSLRLFSRHTSRRTNPGIAWGRSGNCLSASKARPGGWIRLCKGFVNLEHLVQFVPGLLQPVLGDIKHPRILAKCAARKRCGVSLFMSLYGTLPRPVGHPGTRPPTSEASTDYSERPPEIQPTIKFPIGHATGNGLVQPHFSPPRRSPLVCYPSLPVATPA